MLLWRRLDHPGLKYVALALLGIVSLRLTGDPFVPGFHAWAASPLLNWRLYTYLVPVCALAGSAAALRPLEIPRLRSSEGRLYFVSQPMGAIAAGIAALLVFFVWMNLEIANWFATGDTLTVSFGADPAQRLTVSIVWAVYALALLAWGTFRRSSGLRWISLIFLCVTIGKVFLYDLGQLRDLYRVASLFGLATSLILVSLLYQRFVFGRYRENEGEVAAGE